MPKMAVALVIAAFFLKAAVVPFHAWAPDAYEAAAMPVTAYMAAIIKAGVLLAAVRLFGTAPLSAFTIELLAWLPLASIVWGNLAAMRQQSLRRMIAYSSIAHAGYLFYAFLGEGAGRFEAVAFYVLAYGLMNVLAFAALPRSDDDVARDRLQPPDWTCAPQAVCRADDRHCDAVAGRHSAVPGFVAKFLIFKNVMAAGYTTYAVLGLVGSYIAFTLSACHQHLFMSTEDGASSLGASGRYALGATLICLVGTILIGVFPGWVMASSNKVMQAGHRVPTHQRPTPRYRAHSTQPRGSAASIRRSSSSRSTGTQSRSPSDSAAAPARSE